MHVLESTAVPARRSRLATGTVVRALLAVAILAWLVYSTGVDVLLEELSTIAWPSLLAVFGAMAIETTLRAFAWGRAMALAIGRDRASLRRADILRCYLASSFIGAVVPSSAGTDVVRAVLGRRYFGGELASHAAAIVGLNLIGWFAGAAVGCVGLLMVMATTDSPEALAIPGLVVVVALVALPLVFASLRSRVLSTSIRRGLRRSFAIRRHVRRFTRATRATAEHPGASLAVLGLSIAAILAQSAEYVAASHATGIAVPIGAWLLLPVLLGIAGLVPASLLGFGVNQALIVGVLAIFGVGAAESLACAMLIAVAALAVKILGGSIAMAFDGPADAGVDRRAWPEDDAQTTGAHHPASADIAAADSTADAALEVTVVVVNRNGMTTLPRTLASLAESGVALGGIIVADDGSTDGTPEWVERRYPEARVIRLPHSGRANIARNAGLRAVRTPYAFLTDNDITVLPGSLARLLQTLKSRPGILCVTPRLLDDRRSEIIYADGNSLHFLALSGTSARGASVASRPPQPPFATFGGGIMLIRMSHARTTGLMDEGLLHGWADDAEFQLRGRLLGFEALHDSHSAMLHEDKHHGSNRAFGQTANRYRVLLSTYSWKTLLLLAPSLLAFELALTLASLRLGVGAERWRAVRHVWSTRREILAKRAVLRSRRRVSDRALLAGGSFQLPGIVHGSGITGVVLKTAQWLFALNWRAVRRWL